MPINNPPNRAVGPVSPEPWRFKLFMLGSQPKSRSGLANIRGILQDRLGDNFTLEIFDLEKDPTAARTNQILIIPTLLRTSPEPQIRLVGTFGNRDVVVAALDLSVAHFGNCF